jgi:hypothetical protein
MSYTNGYFNRTLYLGPGNFPNYYSSPLYFNGTVRAPSNAFGVRSFYNNQRLINDSGGRIYGGYGRDGVYLRGGSRVVNHGYIVGGQRLSHGYFGGYGYGVYLSNSRLVNYGAVKGGANGGTGVIVRFGSMYNDRGAIYGGSGFYGGRGVRLDGGYGYNFSRIYGGSGTGATGGAGVFLENGARFNNQGRIFGGSGFGQGGRGASLYSGYLKNYSYITGGTGRYGNGGVGVYVGSSAQVRNLGGIYGGSSTQSANGGAGVTLYGTLDTSGTIAGGLGNTSVQADSVDFRGSSGVLRVESYARFNGDIGGFAPGDTVDFTNLSPTTVQNDFNPITYTIATGSDGTLVFNGPFTGEQFTFTSDGGGGTDVTVVVPCFCRGTSIRTQRGEAAVESLRIGDCVTTMSGQDRPIHWIGRRSYSSAFASGNRKVLPVLIRAGALSQDVPHRDLWVSPEHAMFIDGMLIPAQALVNGMSIRQPDATAEVAYFHLEFDAHEVIYAEGAPSESYVDEANRHRFDNAAEYATLYPDAVPAPARFCAPRTEEGEALEVVRQRLAMRAEALARRERRAA